MNGKMNIASIVARVMTLIGVVVLLAGVAAAAFVPARGSPGRSTDLIPAIALLAAGVALIAGAIALDRWACRRDDTDASPGFDVVVSPKEDGPER